ncbi:MAG: hypothetical protein OXO49_03155 [Gammaproteobacteria bacterium]|nr:hypothetical protein [Gammaproteobacteria bacterium]MDE0251977.1 hypothetical protein [Gammaproteobacteria bacterium]MDE0402915.1 hypothetical protein [Gammaproteobacteria bacterium]
MTAEVAIANKTAVALAADSAVSIGPTADKIYTSALKIFQLVEGAPVGIMVSGDAEFLGIPWETIIKAYREKRGRGHLAKLIDYRDDFLEFVETHEKLFPTELQDRYVDKLIESYFRYVLKLIKDETDKLVKRGDQITTDETTNLIQDVVFKEQNRVAQANRLDAFNEEVIRRIRRSFVRRVNRIKEEVFLGLPLSDRTSRMLTNLTFDLLSRSEMGAMHSGLAFAGFGDDEYLPRIYSVALEIMFNNRIRWHEEDRYEVNEEQEDIAAIIPFAQADMVDAFMQGIHPQIDQNRFITVKTVLETFVDRIAAITEQEHLQLGIQLRANFAECVQSILSDIKTDWQLQSEEHATPVILNVSVLPKDELGAMAESLANLTKFRLRVSLERETVSGPIDVAIISKGDGFVWLKRKHYFQAELNPRVVSEYDRRI